MSLKSKSVKQYLVEKVSSIVSLFQVLISFALLSLGKYAYLDASSQRERDKAWLVSDYFNSSITCFRFSYYIDDTSGGLLKVYQQNLGSAKRLLWTAPQRRVSKWFEINMTIPHTGVNSAYRVSSAIVIVLAIGVRA